MRYEEAVLQLAAMCSEPDQFHRLIAAGLHEGLLAQGPGSDEARVFAFAREYFERDGTCPTRRVLEAEFPQFFKTREIPPESDTQPEHLVKTLRNRYVKNRTQDLIANASDRIFDDAADQTLVFAQIYREWGAIVSDTSRPKRTPRFPIEALPAMTRDTLVRLADAQDVAIDYVASQGLVVAAAAVGTTRVIKAHTDERVAQRPQPASLYSAIVGEPGTAKTESRYFLEQPVRRKEEEYVADFERASSDFLWKKAKAKQDHDDLKKRHEAAVREWIKSAEGERPEPPEGMLGGDADEEPAQQHAWTDSATIEGIADALCTSPRGLLVCPDELAKLWLGLNKYSGGTGNDKQHFLEAWNAGAWNIIRADRKRNKYIPRAHISIVGGLQPELLHLLQGDYDDGTFERWLYTWPEVDHLAKPKVTDRSFLGTWDTIVDRLYSLGWASETDPGLVLLDEDAFAVREADYELIRDLWATDDGALKGFYGKWGQYWARLALILHLLKWAEGDRVDPMRVDGDAARGATLLMEYYLGMDEKVLAQVRGEDGPDGADGVRLRVCAKCGTSFTGRQASAKYCSDNCRKRAHEKRRA